MHIGTSEMSPVEISVARASEVLAVAPDGTGTVPLAWLTRYRERVHAGMPRRIQQHGMTPAEIAIRDAGVVVDRLPPDPRLTRALQLLADARVLVADYVDGK